MLTEELLLLGVSTCTFLCCRLFLKRALRNDLECFNTVPQDVLPQTATPPKPSSREPWHSTLAQSSFSICFTVCCMLFAMLLCQGFSLLDPLVRLYTWRVSLFLLFSVIIVFVPASFCIVLAYRSETPKLLNLKSVSFLLPVALFVFALSFVPLPAEYTSYNPLISTSARLVVLGTIVLGLLSGLGAVNAAWGAFSHKTAVPSAASITSAENALEQIRSDLRGRAHNLDTYETSKPQINGSWLSRVTFKRDTHKGTLQQEVIGLQALESQMTKRVEILKRNRDNTTFAMSMRGKILSRVWAMYCICRVFSSVVNLLLPLSSIDSDRTSSYGDIIAHFFAYFFSLLPVIPGKASIDIPSLSRQISLLLVGAIILSSVRVVLTGVTRAFRITSRNITASLMLLLLAQLMGIYLLSTLVQLRTMFPPLSVSTINMDDDYSVNLFSSLPQYSLFGGLFDWSFLFGAVVSALLHCIKGMFGGDFEDYI